MPDMEHLAYDCIVHLYESKEKNIFYIDKLPIPVGEDGDAKIDQIDIDYQQVIDGKALKDDFIKVESKYRNVINKLWIYNKTFVEFVLPGLYFEKPDIVIDNNYKEYLSELDGHTTKEGRLFEVNKKKKLEFWLQLGMRDAISVAFYLEDYKAIIVPSWSCFIMYLHDIKYYQIIKDIVISEGLFLRHRL